MQRAETTIDEKSRTKLQAVVWKDTAEVRYISTEYVGQPSPQDFVKRHGDENVPATPALIAYMRHYNKVDQFDHALADVGVTFKTSRFEDFLSPILFILFILFLVLSRI